MFKILDSGHSKLGAIKSILLVLLRGFSIDEITQSGFTLLPENTSPATEEVSQADVA